ncbi:MAG: hypothetical protein ACJAS9_000921 [Polaribacter sp.]|jgi:hypothetical protein
MKIRIRIKDYPTWSVLPKSVMPNFSICTIILMTSVMFSCSTHSAMNRSEKSAIKLPVECKKMVPVEDIWKLEPILVKQGKIKEYMTKAEKEWVIRHYINDKSKQYEICLNTRKK